jgi:hypothetical protein
MGRFNASDWFPGLAMALATILGIASWAFGRFDIKDWQPWLPGLFTVLGWAIVNAQNNHREARKECRALIDSSKKISIEICKQATDYMCVEDRNEATEADIKAALDQLEIELNRFQAYAREHRLIEALAKFADLATSADFESNARRPRKKSDTEPQALMIARNELLTRLEEFFATRYQK